MSQLRQTTPVVKNPLFLRRALLIGTILSLVCGTPPEALAWGLKGHRIVGILADLHIEPSMRKKYQRDFNISRLSDIANWADRVKRQRSQRAWHYLNLPEGERQYRRNRDCPDGQCVLEKILEFSRILKDPDQNRKKREEALMYLVHFVADVHQPLHLGYAKDRGGNEIPLKFKDEATDLHTLWDDGLIPAREEDLLQYARNLDNRISKADIALWTGSSVTGWAKESRAIVLDHVYAFGSGEVGLSKRYIEKSQEIVDLRLSQAGIRLARLLSALLE